MNYERRQPNVYILKESIKKCETNDDKLNIV